MNALTPLKELPGFADAYVGAVEYFEQKPEERKALMLLGDTVVPGIERITSSVTLIWLAQAIASEAAQAERRRRLKLEIRHTGATNVVALHLPYEHSEHGRRRVRARGWAEVLRPSGLAALRDRDQRAEWRKLTLGPIANDTGSGEAVLSQPMRTRMAIKGGRARIAARSAPELTGAT